MTGSSLEFSQVLTDHLLSQDPTNAKRGTFMRGLPHSFVLRQTITQINYVFKIEKRAASSLSNSFNLYTLNRALPQVPKLKGI